MNITRWDPFAELEQMLDRYNRDLRLGNAGSQERMASTDWTPAVDIKETKEAYLIHAELPGIEKDDVKITLNEGVLTIAGERKFEKETDEDKNHRIERFYGQFSRSFRLPDDVDAEHIDAEFKNGMLNLKLLKVEKSEPKAIEVKIN